MTAIEIISSPRSRRTASGDAPAIGRNVRLETRLKRAIAGDVLFDAFSRGRYATDASIYQIMPAGVVLPRSRDDLATVIAIAREEGVPVIMRGGGTSQNGQPIGSGLVVDCSRHFNQKLAYDAAARTVSVEPGMVLEHLNQSIRGDGLIFPVEPSTASRCTIGGMTGNNSCGARSLRYGRMAENVLAVDALLADGSALHFATGMRGELADAMRGLADRERDEIAARFPKVQRRVGGYNLDSLIGPDPNMAELLVGSEGTLAAFTAVTLKLSALPRRRVMGVAQFPSFRAAMETTSALVDLAPTAVELVDNNVLVLGADLPVFRSTLAAITRGTPDCLLLVEFAGDEEDALHRDLRRLDQAMADHGFPDSVVAVTEPNRQRQVWEVREACLNIMMSMKGDAKPVSFIEDCAVPLTHLADYTDQITDLFARHGTRGTWYAHASVGCLHVRPILNMKDAGDIARMRAIAEAACDVVRRFKGSYSGEHGDGISRSEFIRPMFGERLTAAFGEVKRAFDPEGLLNPAKIVDAPRFDDRSLMRFKPDYAASAPASARLDWSAHGSFAAAVEMCNNNGTCRKLSGGGMCPSYRVTRDEAHTTRGRANTLRLAISGQLGPGALTSPDTKAALALCVGCKACKRECPTGVDMARLKTEVLAHYHDEHGLGLRERLVAELPRYARFAAILAPLLNLRDAVPGLALASERLLGLARDRSLPRWRRPWQEVGPISTPADVIGDGRDVVLFGDTFNRAFERENLEAAERVLDRLGYRSHRVMPSAGRRPLCCGRTYLAAGQIDQARAEARRTAHTLVPFVARGARIVGLEPSCLLTFRDEFAALLPKDEAEAMARSAFLLEEAIAADRAQGLIDIAAASAGTAHRVAHVHGHCHQKSAGAFDTVTEILRAVPGLEVRVIESACCGMAGAFGYQAETRSISQAMAELSLLPAVRAAAPADLVVADGTSCRHQIADGAGRQAVHVVRVLDEALAAEQFRARPAGTRQSTVADRAGQGQPGAR